MNNFIKRTLTGIIYVVVLLGAIFCGPMSYAALFCLIVGLSLWEFYGLLKHYEDAALRRVISTGAGVYLFIASYLSAAGYGNLFFMPYLFYLLYIFIGELYAKAPNPIENWGYTLLGQIYCAGSFSLLNFIAIQPGTVTHEPEYHVRCSSLFGLMIQERFW